MSKDIEIKKSDKIPGAELEALRSLINPNCKSLSVGKVIGGSAVGMFASRNYQPSIPISSITGETKISVGKVSGGSAVGMFASTNGKNTLNTYEKTSNGPIQVTVIDGQETMTVGGKTYIGKNLVYRDGSVHIDGVRQ